MVVSSNRVPIGVVVPARDEADGIGRCLASLANQSYRGNVHVVVVANGCSDHTAFVAREFAAKTSRQGFRIDVLELAEGSKCLAINAGEALLPNGIKVYLDADIELSHNALGSMHEALRKDAGVHACAPRIQVSPPTSLWARHFGQIWSSLPYVANEVIGAGCVAVSAQGRRRWGVFPNIIADDMFVLSHFHGDEKRVLVDCRYGLKLPEKLGELISVRSRWQRGRWELTRLIRRSPVSTRPQLGLLRHLSTRPRLWPCLPTYVLVNVLARCLAALRLRKGTALWERSESARSTPVGLVHSTPADGPIAGGSDDGRRRNGERP
jgi:glycosyltransferase involved in cell wall biosynthesis